jgi:hypothetical protein
MGAELDFMKEEWAKSTKSCSECDLPLMYFNPAFLSHILSKGAYPELRLDPENIQIHCFDCHQQWEFGDKKSMKCYNEKLINKLKLKANVKSKNKNR